MPRLHVLMATARFWPEIGGVETHCLEIGRRLVDAGFAVTVAATDRTRTLPPRETVDGVAIHRFPAYPQGMDLYVSPRLTRFVAQSPADIVHCQGYHTAVAPMVMFGARAGKRPYVLSLHSGGHSSARRTALRPLQALLLRPLLSGAAAIVAGSRWEADHMAPLFGLEPDQLEVIPSGVETVGLSGVTSKPEPGLIVSPGRLERYKGHHRVIDALPLVIERRPDARLLVLGDGPAKEMLSRQVVDLGLADRVVIEAATGREAVAEELARASVVVSLSEYESQGLAVHEALALERPTIVRDGTALGELVRAGAVRGLPADASRAEIAAAIVAELEAPTRLTHPSMPSWDGAAERLADLYVRVAGERQKSPVLSA